MIKNHDLCVVDYNIITRNNLTWLIMIYAAFNIEEIALKYDRRVRNESNEKSLLAQEW